MKMLVPVALLALTAGALQAEKLDMRFGVLGGVTLPQGDLKNKARYGTNQTMGYHIGVFAGVPLNTNNEIRPNVEYYILNGSEWTTTFNSDPFNGNPSPYGPWSDFIKRDFKILHLGADWLYHMDRLDSGIYLLGGLAFASVKSDWKVDYNYNQYLDRVALASGSASQNKISFKVGLGFNFNSNFAIEASYNHTPVDDGKVEASDPYDGAKEGYDWHKGFGFSRATWINISGTFRFGGGK